MLNPNVNLCLIIYDIIILCSIYFKVEKKNIINKKFIRQFKQVRGKGIDVRLRSKGPKLSKKEKHAR